MEACSARHTVGPSVLFPAMADTQGVFPPVPSTQWALFHLASLSCRWYTRSPATGPTPSGSTPCWTPHKYRAAGAKPTPKTKSSEWGCKDGGQCYVLWYRGLGGGQMTSLSGPAPHCLLCAPCSPIKSEFIRAKYQMLAFVHKLPCRDDDGVTAKDLSKVRGAPRRMDRPFLFFPDP